LFRSQQNTRKLNKQHVLIELGTLLLGLLLLGIILSLLNLRRCWLIQNFDISNQKHSQNLTYHFKKGLRKEVNNCFSIQEKSFQTTIRSNVFLSMQEERRILAAQV